MTDQAAWPKVTRKEALTGAALIGIGAGLDRVIGGVSGPRASGRPVLPSGIVPFRGAHQAGIATPAQDYLHFAAFDVTSEAVEDLRSLLTAWTAAADMLTRGAPYGPNSEESNQPPADTGEAMGLDASQLTITFGFGPSLFASGDRFGLAQARPAGLRPLPTFKGESIEPAISGGNLCVQACANDPQVAFHAIHMLARIASPVAAMRWDQLGFGRTSSTSRTQQTPRNLMGFKDGTDNIRSEDTGAMNEYVWVQPVDVPDWMVGGTYLIARRIKILFDVWNAATLEGQQQAIGRDKLTGAPLGATYEYDPVDLAATTYGVPVIPSNAHIRLANPENNEGQRILRRGYSYSEAVEPGTADINAGLFFIAFQRDPDRQFIPIQRRLAENDALNRHTLHTSSSIFAIPPGIQRGGFVGEGLFSSSQ